MGRSLVPAHGFADPSVRKKLQNSEPHAGPRPPHSHRDPSRATVSRTPSKGARASEWSWGRPRSAPGRRQSQAHRSPRPRTQPTTQRSPPPTRHTPPRRHAWPPHGRHAAQPPRHHHRGHPHHDNQRRQALHTASRTDCHPYPTNTKGAHRSAPPPPHGTSSRPVYHLPLHPLTHATHSHATRHDDTSPTPKAAPAAEKEALTKTAPAVKENPDSPPGE